MLIFRFFVFVDNVPFGEVTMAPPSLSAKPKKAPVKSQVTCSNVLSLIFMAEWEVYCFFCSASIIPKGTKKLLLNSLLGHTVASATKPSMARQRIMEEERERAVEAYRHLKKRKQEQNEARTASMEKLKNLQ